MRAKQIIAVLLLLLTLFCLSGCALLVTSGPTPRAIEAAPAVTERPVVVEEMPVVTEAPVEAPAEETETDR